MTLNAKWTAVSFFALAAMGAASMAFAGCTVTSGTVDNSEGGTGTNTDSGTTADSATDSAVNACPGNTKQTTKFINDTCQKLLESECCAELTTCFNIVPDTSDAGGGGTDDCNKYSQCIPKCRFKIDGVTPETDETKIGACQDDCDLAAPKSVVDAYKAIETCVTNKPASNAACQ